LEQFIERKQEILEKRKQRTSIDALRAMASMQTRPFPFLTTIGGGVQVVGQIRYRLPVTGDLTTRYDPVRAAKSYVEAGADAIAMFTDAVPEYDSSVDMTLVSEAMGYTQTPVINQDYMLDEYNVIAARATGASVVVLTSGLVPPEKLRLLLSAVHRNRMTAVLDVFDEAQLETALSWSPQVIGLSSTETIGTVADLDCVARLCNHIPAGQQVIITNPLHELDDLRRAADIGVDAVTVSERLLLGTDPNAIRNALGQR